MKKYITIIASFIVLFASNSLSAQSAANELVSRLANAIRSHNSLEVSFTYQTIGDTKQSDEIKEGHAYFQGESYKILLADQHTISNGTTKWSYLVDDEEVMVGNVTDDDNPFKILDELERNSSGFTPTVDAKGNLKKLEIEMDEGVKMILNITEMKFDQVYPDSFFTFDQKAYPHVDIIDMR